MFKNVASQKLSVYCFDSTTNLPVTGDAANLTAYESLDDGSVTAITDTSASEQSSSNAAGFYLFDLSQAETNANKIMFSCVSVTANVVCLCMPAVVYTTPANFTALSISAGGLVDILQAAADKVWGTATRVLTAATNLTTALATPTNITAGTLTTVGTVTNPVTVGTNNDKTGYALTTAACQAVADAWTARNIAGGSSTGRTNGQAMASLRNKQEIAGGVLTVYAADDVTPLWTGAVTTAPGDPLASIDPA